MIRYINQEKQSPAKALNSFHEDMFYRLSDAQRQENKEEIDNLILYTMNELKKALK